MDITDRIKREEEMMKQLMKFRLEDGNLYLITEQTPSISIEALNDVLKLGHKGILISRARENEFNNKYKAGYL